MPEQMKPDEVPTEGETVQDASVSCIVVALTPLQLTLERLVRNVLIMAIATLLLGCVVMLVAL